MLTRPVRRGRPEGELADGALAPPVDLVVVGAHLAGEPLNGQLVDRGATLVGTVRTAAHYRLWALDTIPPKPGLLRVTTDGAVVTGERWRLPAEGFGAFVAALVAPMTIGQIELVDGSRVPGFLVEPAAVEHALDITAYGGWRAYLDATRRPPSASSDRTGSVT